MLTTEDVDRIRVAMKYIEAGEGVNLATVLKLLDAIETLVGLADSVGEASHPCDCGDGFIADPEAPGVGPSGPDPDCEDCHGTGRRNAIEYWRTESEHWYERANSWRLWCDDDGAPESMTDQELRDGIDARIEELEKGVVSMREAALRMERRTHKSWSEKVDHMKAERDNEIARAVNAETKAQESHEAMVEGVRRREDVWNLKDEMERLVDKAKDELALAQTALEGSEIELDAWYALDESLVADELHGEAKTLLLEAKALRAKADQ